VRITLRDISRGFRAGWVQASFLYPTADRKPDSNAFISGPAAGPKIHVPFFIAAGALVAGIAILATAHGLLGEAERVQAGHVPATAEGRREELEDEAMVVAEGSET